MGKASVKDLKPILEAAFKDFHHENESRLDPISLVYRYQTPHDRELVAVLVALLSYGNVRTIIQSGNRMLAPLGTSPFEYLISESPLHVWDDFKHRFTTGVDIEIVSHWLRQTLRKHGSIESFFAHTNPSATTPMKLKISNFVRGLWSQPLPKCLIKKLENRQRNLKYLISDPEQGSACKRLNMFLRWVVRPQDGVDLGLWKTVSTRELMLPIDTHLLQTLKKLRWVNSDQANWKTVERATQKLREISENDPIRYDFALCHLSMSGGNINNYQKSKDLVGA